MDLSHMVAMWLAGQGGSEMPDGVRVLYAPPPAVPIQSEAGSGRGETANDAKWVYPFSADRLALGCAAAEKLPRGGGVQDLSASQECAATWVRPGLGLIGELEYGPDGLDGFVPRLFAAVNMPEPGGQAITPNHEAMAPSKNPDVSVNRGEASIGLSDRLGFVDRFDVKGVLGRMRVVGFIERAGEVVQGCAEVAVADFPVMFGTLSDYLCFQVAAQVAGNGYDDLAGVLASSDRPTHAVVVAGLSKNLEPRISPPGPDGLEAGDVCHSVVYDTEVVTLEEIETSLISKDSGVLIEREGVSWLRQVVE